MPSHPPTRTETDWAAVLAAVLGGVAVAMNVGKVPIALPQLRAEFGLSLVASGWVASMINALAVSMAIAFGLLCDRLGALQTCLMGLAFAILGSLGGLLAGGESGLLASRFAEGVGVVSVSVSAPALLSSAAAPADRRFALGIWSAYLPAGVGLVMLLAPALVPVAGWRGIWTLCIAALLAAALAIYRSRTAYRLLTRAAGGAPSFAAAKAVMARREPWLLAFAMASFTIQHFALIIWLPTFLQEQRGLAPLAVSLLSCAMVLANVPGNLLGGSLLQRNFRRGSLIAAASLVTGLAGVGIFLDLLPDAVRYALCVLLSFAGGLIPASVLSASASLARTARQVGTLQGLFIQVGNVGPFFGPPLIAMVVATSGLWRDALFVTGSAALVGVVLGLAIRRHER